MGDCRLTKEGCAFMEATETQNLPVKPESNLHIRF